MAELQDGPLHWELARTPAEREEVYRFRYDHYYRNLPAAPGVDHRAQRVYLPIDEESTHLTGRDGHGNLVITGTGTPASTHGIPEEWREILRLNTLACLDLERILIFARLVEHEHHRGGPVFSAFFRFSAAHFVERGFAYSVHYCAPPLVPLYERAGYRIYGPGYTMRSGLFRLPMILAAADAAYLARVNASFAQALDGASGDLAQFRSLLPETRKTPLCAMSGQERLDAVRAILAPNLEPGEAVAQRIPDSAAKALRRASILTLAPGDIPANPTDQPLLWFVLAGEMILNKRDGSAARAVPGDFIDGHAVQSCNAPGGGTLVAFAPRKTPESGQAVLSPEYWHSLV